MKQPPFFVVDALVTERWFSLLDGLGVSVAEKCKSHESAEATHQIYNLSHAGAVVTWFEIAKEKISGRLILVYGPPYKQGSTSVYTKAQDLLIEAGAQKLVTLTPP
jgi:hypothetical protein